MTRSINSVRRSDNEAIDGSNRFSHHLLRGSADNVEDLGGKEARIKNISLFARKLVLREQRGNLSRVYFALSSTIHRFLLIIGAVYTVKPYATETYVYKRLFHLVTRAAHVTGPVRSHRGGPFFLTRSAICDRRESIDAPMIEQRVKNSTKLDDIETRCFERS